MATARERHLKERDTFQEKQDEDRHWHRPQEHTFEVEATGPQGGSAKPIVGGTAAGFVFLDTGGEKRLDKDSVHTLISLEAARLAVS